jgi:cell wall-associated NlpC family hydrolase
MMSLKASTALLVLLATASLLVGCDAARTLKDVDLRSSSCPANIQQGATGSCVTSLQNLLNSKGASLSVDGDFGPATFSAVKNFQSSRGLEVDGIVGPNTKNALYSGSGPAPVPATGSLATVLSAARAEIGTPYVWGGGHKAQPGKSTGTCSGYTGSIQPCPAETTVGYDCSGLTRWAYFKAFGSDVNNGATGTQESALSSKRTTNPVPGDLIFWDGHTAIYSGANSMIEAKQTGTDVHEVALRSGGRYYHY